MGMIVPQYWAESRIQDRHNRRQVTVRRWGWSDEGPRQAQAHADGRARDALRRILDGGDLPRREPRVPYNGAEGVPIREEIVSRHGETVVTRNGYGALCINTPDVLFADIDFGAPSFSWKPLLLSALAAGLGAAILASGKRVGWGLAAFVGALVLLPLASRLLRRIRVALAGGEEAYAVARIERFVNARSGWKVRIYRTPVGVRALALHRRFDPASPEALEFFRDLGSDPLYVRMCLRQHCFRARVSPKPWRIGVGGHLRPRPGVWPVRPERKPERDRWIAAYEEAARGYASCRFLKEVGWGAADSGAEAVRVLHDDLSRALGLLPLA